MKKIFSVLVLLFLVISASAQIPFFGTTVGKNKTYTYLQWKVFPGNNNQNFYMSAKYGVTSRGDASLAYYDSPGYNVTSIGWTQNIIKNSYFNFAIQPMVAFNMRDNFKFSDVTTGFYISGYLTNKLSYELNTWYTQYESSNWWSQWSYIGYDIWKVTVSVGAQTEYSDKCKTDLAAGVWFPIRKSTYVYLWGGNLTKNLGDIKITAGIDYKF